MDIQELHSMGGLVSAKPIKSLIEVDRPLLKPKDEWSDPTIAEFTGETEDASIDVYVKRITSADTVAFAKSDGEDEMFVAIYRMILNPDGSRLFESVEQCRSLAPWLLTPLINVIKEQIPKKSPSTHTTNSGSKSRSRSGGARRKNGKKQSARNGKTK